MCPGINDRGIRVQVYRYCIDPYFVVPPHLADFDACSCAGLDGLCSSCDPFYRCVNAVASRFTRILRLHSSVVLWGYIQMGASFFVSFFEFTLVLKGQ